ncbi:hypothetical protein [Allostreptomyces psammosilenae]|uniref:Integral membrane protein n=1 Tax=Allostreptomyces psammosilenae TaxID=1892865 RepID=A0A853A061_9ACTN|nr:hypothetical protein [Allostreptomyces psammosilenae]NYI07497.1 hypothetical protein [Allostreptomyces psammosilenae]
MPVRSPSPTPSPSPSASFDSCELVPGAAQAGCQQGTGTVPQLPGSEVVDPLGSLAAGCAEAASWVITRLSDAIVDTTQVDFTNAGFLRQYAVVFAASTVLTLVLWLLAIAKRAVRGVPMGQAFSEAIGYLWLTVLASAFTPLILYTLVAVTDSLTEVIASGTQDGTDRFLGGFAEALDPANDIGGGPIVLILVSLLSVLAAAVLWLELLIRAAMLYVGALLGTIVYSGLVDRSLWRHVRRWAGLMLAIDLIKPVIIIVLGLAGAVSVGGDEPDAFSAILSGLAILALSIFASVAIYRFVPGFGDDMVALHSARRQAVSGGRAAINGTANFVKQGISTHGSRGTAEARPGPQRSGAAPSAASAVTPGIAAHSSRGTGRTAPPPPAPPGLTGRAGDQPRGANPGGDR